MGNGFVPYQRIDIFERDCWKCMICGKQCKRGERAPHPLAATIDHIRPVSKGGRDAPDNVQCAHFVCNAMKSDALGHQPLLIG